MAHNVKQVPLAKIHFPLYVGRLYSLSMSLSVLLFLNFLKRAATYFVVAVILAVGSIVYKLST